MLRLPVGMRDKIREAADANNRSMNSEILARLYASFGDPQNVATLSMSFNLDSLESSRLQENIRFLKAFLEDVSSGRMKSDN